MSNLNNITNKILSDAKQKSEEIIKESREEEEKIIEKMIQEARIIETEILERAKRESATKKERIISNSQLKVRNEKLEAKQKIIDKVFEKAVEELNNMSIEAFNDYLVERIKTMDISGDETLILSSSYLNSLSESKKKKSGSNFVEMVKEKLHLDELQPEIINRINSELTSIGKKGDIKLSPEGRDFKGGFVLEKNGVLINNTFEALVRSLRDELEYDIAKVLFE
ncbi:V-type ATP synthase subunit E [Clostridium polynesiense]|uniref:V-type ATP synthase subunit E n=1 Tax=Clostridium polynesiense TaxID=1325933 RepID=UPI00058C934C|nr:V-type ATP synthase subunit E family protein [Clostridium polynesiense]